MKPIETYMCGDCKFEWGLPYPSWETPSCPNCGEHLNVVETTDMNK
jgi:transcription initiation factor IIE alpha subunit